MNLKMHDAQSDLKRLRAATEEILLLLKPGDYPNEAINWADLHCVEARQIINDEGGEYLEVGIQEASPDCGKMPQAVRERLALQGWKDVSVVTEW